MTLLHSDQHRHLRWSRPVAQHSRSRNRDRTIRFLHSSRVWHLDRIVDPWSQHHFDLPGAFVLRRLILGSGQSQTLPQYTATHVPPQLQDYEPKELDVGAREMAQLFGPQHLHWVTHSSCNSSSRESAALYWPPHIRGTYT